jgi:2-octaprenyl-6-methoxyphenol hydroxylase
MPADVLIRGAGPVGCVLALLLRQSGKNVVLEPGTRSRTAIFRPLALSYASRLILERAGAWPAATPIRTVHVSRQGAFGRARMSAEDAGVDCLGYVAQYDDLLDALLQTVAYAGIPQDVSEAKLVVHAEGSSAEAGEKPYAQEAIVALVSTEPAASDTAFERFTPEGPLALLPLAGRYAVVWGMRPERSQVLCAAPEKAFLDALGAAFGRRAGRFIGVEKRARFPLTLRVRPSRIGERAAYVGNAAQTLHPVAGQGLNLGLRDAWDLAQAVRDAEDPGDARTLRRFAATRRIDAFATVRVTDFLASGFSGANPMAGLMRGFALTALDTCLPARRFFARRMIYGASALP